MSQVEKIDYTLLALFKEIKDGGMLNVIRAFKENNQELTIEELREIKSLLENEGYAVFQIAPRGVDFRGQITEKGIAFVKTDSYSQPGTSILKL